MTCSKDGASSQNDESFREIATRDSVPRGLEIRAARSMDQHYQRIAGRKSVKTLIREVVFLSTLAAPGHRACMDQPTLGRIAGRGARHRPRLCQKSNGH